MSLHLSCRKHDLLLFPTHKLLPYICAISLVLCNGFIFNFPVNDEGIGFVGKGPESMAKNVGEFEAEGCLIFRFPTYEEFRQIQKEAGMAVDSDLTNAGFTSAGSSFVRASIDERATEEINQNNLEPEKITTMGFSKKFQEGGFQAQSAIADCELESGTPEIKEQGGTNWDSDNTAEDSKSEGDTNEHQELVEQLRMELKKVRATGTGGCLPTILEESDTLKIVDDLKPWKIDRFKRENCIGELHKLYRSYRERMRKFDIINYQKMYAMGTVQLRMNHPQQKNPPSAIKSLLLSKFKNRIHGGDDGPIPMKELHGDLEAVYVGQTCLSWEFLQWQYEKALDLWDADPQGIRRYNQVAGEFQQFQVLLQRFVEDEPFQDHPRMDNYVNSRCLNRNLLQVPVTREDGTKNRTRKRDNAITTTELVEIMEESIRIFWRYIRGDKDCCISTTTSAKKMPEVSSPEDVKILIDTRKIVIKKDRKLKDCLRSENCMLRKLRLCREDGDDLDQVLCFFSQVDMKLVWRVLNMSRVTRDQIIWCRNKLDRISFDSRKIYVEPAFFLFPCLTY